MNDPTVISIIASPLPIVSTIVGAMHTFVVLGRTKLEPNYIVEQQADVLEFQQGGPPNQPLQPGAVIERKEAGKPPVIETNVYPPDDCMQEILCQVEGMAEWDVKNRIKRVVEEKANTGYAIIHYFA
jgi:hypothetical protein